MQRATKRQSPSNRMTRPAAVGRPVTPWSCRISPMRHTLLRRNRLSFAAHRRPYLLCRDAISPAGTGCSDRIRSRCHCSLFVRPSERLHPCDQSDGEKRHHRCRRCDRRRQILPDCREHLARQSSVLRTSYQHDHNDFVERVADAKAAPESTPGTMSGSMTRRNA